MNEALAISTAWLSPESRSDESSAALKAAAVVLANLTADISVHMPSEQFDPFRDKVVDVLVFLDKIMPLVTPVVVSPPVTAPSTVVPPVDPNIPKPATAAAPPPPPPPPPPKAAVTPSALPKAVAALMSKMPANQQQATMAAMGNAPVYTSLRQSLRDEAVAIGLGTTVPSLLADELPESITDEIKAAVDTFGDPMNDYESAVIAVEIWR